MSTSALSFRTYHGRTLLIDIQASSPDPDADFTAAVYVASFKRNATDPDSEALYRLTNGSGITIENPAGTHALAELTPAQTETLPLNTPIYFDVVVTLTSTSVWTLGEGTIVFLREITVTP